MFPKKNTFFYQMTQGFPGDSVVKNLPANVGDTGDVDFSWVRKIPWRRKWQSTPVFLPGKSPGQRSLEGCSPWGHKELDTTRVIMQKTQVSC